ncbi:tryptophan dimethylallyltransferase family protein [Hyalangium versicolor]|uniref:tryptophan dimethylallyltransferase family protein n=1 Tax=Hyalangium versicolor TaxID=2861190 RepID=UPI001CC9F236|nr:tryptophan dimethylallyltransferase family protein [Hyalangium versicolor]
MQRVLEYLREKQRDFGGSPFVRFLQETRFSPQDRLSFLPCVAPFVLGFRDLDRALRGGEVEPPADGTNPHEGPHWALYVQDLQVLGLGTANDFAGMLRLLWGADGSQTRRALYDLIDLATGASPAKNQVLMMALEAMGRVTLEALAPIVRAFEARSRKKLVSIPFLSSKVEQGLWAETTVELDLRPEQEQEALAALDEAFQLLGELSDLLLAHMQHQLEVKRARFTWEPPSRLTFQEFGTARIQALCDAIGYDAENTETVKRFFTFMSSPWGERRIGTTPPWKSDITDDHTPFELSLAIESDRPEVRFLMEPQNAEGSTTLRTTWEDGLALNERLHQEFGVRLERFEQVKDLFEPVDPNARFALWHAFFLKSNGRPDVKIYLNPAARGPQHSKAVVREALERLGFTGAWRCLSEQVCGENDRILYFSLDLSAHRAARVKIYVSHQDTTAEELESVMALSKEYVPGEAWVFCQALKGPTGAFGTARTALTCLAFTSDEDERPSSVTLHVPVRCFARSDEESMERIRFLMEPHSHAVLGRAVAALAHRPLDVGTGLIQWASMRRQDGKVRTTFYLATEAYGVPAQQTVAPQPALRVSAEENPEMRRLNA